MYDNLTTVGYWHILCPKEETGAWDIKSHLPFLQMYFPFLHVSVLCLALSSFMHITFKTFELYLFLFVM